VGDVILASENGGGVRTNGFIPGWTPQCITITIPPYLIRLLPSLHWLTKQEIRYPEWNGAVDDISMPEGLRIRREERNIGSPVLDTGRDGRGSCSFATFRIVFDALAWGEEVRIK
jgi:hypothetical protein